jgi:hypothetical protein
MIGAMETFVVRVWTPGAPESRDGPQCLRGLVEHVRVGERRVFAGDDELLAMLREGALRQKGASTGPRDTVS